MQTSQDFLCNMIFSKMPFPPKSKNLDIWHENVFCKDLFNWLVRWKTSANLARVGRHLSSWKRSAKCGLLCSWNFPSSILVKFLFAGDYVSSLGFSYNFKKFFNRADLCLMKLTIFVASKSFSISSPRVFDPSTSLWTNHGVVTMSGFPLSFYERRNFSQSQPWKRPYHYRCQHNSSKTDALLRDMKTKMKIHLGLGLFEQLVVADNISWILSLFTNLTNDTIGIKLDEEAVFISLLHKTFPASSGFSPICQLIIQQNVGEREQNLSYFFVL